MIGMRILTDGTMLEFSYNNISELESHIYERGQGEFTGLEHFDYAGKVYNIYGYLKGQNFNKFDLQYYNATGDIIITVLDGDVVKREILDFYKGEDLNDYIVEDELEDDYSNDTYEYGDFVVFDDDI